MQFPNTWGTTFAANVNTRYVKGEMTINGKRKRFYLHRWILSPSPDLDVDHIDHDTLNNRRNNLRVCTNSENSWNRKFQLNNKSGISGVRWKPERKSWIAEIAVNGKQTHLGSFKKIEDAANARKRAEVQHYGEFRRK